MSNGERFYPKQKMADAFRRSREKSVFSGLLSPVETRSRERVRTGDWPAFALRNSRVAERNDLRSAADREISWRAAQRLMSQRMSRRDTRSSSRR